MVNECGLKLHDHVQHLRSSQAFAFNLFLPFTRPDARLHLSRLVTSAIGEAFEADRIDLEWVPPGALLGETRSDRPETGEPATGVDVVLWGRSAGEPAAVLIEVKFTEDAFTHCNGATSPGNARREVCASAELFMANPKACYLQHPRRATRDRRYWEIFEQAHGSVRAAFPGAPMQGRCPFEANAQQPMRNLAIATGLVQAGTVRRAWFALCHHDANPDVPPHWAEWAQLLPSDTPAPALPASAILGTGLAAGGLEDWAVWMSKRYRLPLPGLRYARAPSQEFLLTLAPGGELRFLVEPRLVAGVHLDIHFRERDHLHLYCGLTRVADIAYSRRGVTLSAHKTYRVQAPSLFRNWAPHEFDALRRELDAYMQRVAVGDPHVQKEGAVQSAWCRPGAAAWTPVDREAVVGYPSTELQAAFREFKAVRAAHTEALAQGFALPKERGAAAELDQLAVTEDGALVLVELKHSQANAAALAGAPIQLLQYLWEWHAALPSLAPSIERLIEARRAVGLPAPAVQLSGRLCGVIGFDADKPSPEVQRRMDVILTIANRHRPPGVPEIEIQHLPAESSSHLNQRRPARIGPDR